MKVKDVALTCKHQLKTKRALAQNMTSSHVKITFISFSEGMVANLAI